MTSCYRKIICLVALTSLVTLVTPGLAQVPQPFETGDLPPVEQWQRRDEGPGLPIPGAEIIPGGPILDPEFWVRGMDATKKVVVGEKYKVFSMQDADTATFLCGTQTEMSIWQIEVPLFFGAPGSIDLRVDVELADMTNPSCPVPGTQLCVSGVTSYTIPVTGVWTLGVGIPACGCVPITGAYFFSFEVVSFTSTMSPAILTTSTPNLCQSYIDPDGSGWVDVQTYFGGLPGDVVLQARAVCCIDPVGSLPRSWGEVKRDYREN